MAAQGNAHHHNHEAIALAAADRHSDLPPTVLAPLRHLGLHAPPDDLGQWLNDWLRESTTALGGAVPKTEAKTDTHGTRPH